MDIEIIHISASENKEIGIKQPLLIIFDRGYPSIEFVDYLESEGIYYLFILSSNDYIAERAKMDSTDKAVFLKPTSQRLQKICRKHLERYEHMKEKGQIQIRITRLELPGGFHF